MLVHPRGWQDLRLICREERHYLQDLLRRFNRQCCTCRTRGVGTCLRNTDKQLMHCSLLWIGTTSLLALDLKRRRSTVSPTATGSPTPRFSAESQGTEGDFEKQSNIFDTVSAPQIRDHASPVLPPASPDFDGEQIEPYQPGVAGNYPSQYDSQSTYQADSNLTSPTQSHYSWTGEDFIDGLGSPKPQEVTPHVANLGSRGPSSSGERRLNPSWIRYPDR